MKKLSPELLRATMRARKATWEDLADAADISTAAVGYYLQAPRDPDVKIVVAFAHKLDVEASILLDDYDGEPKACPISQAVEIVENTNLLLEEIADV